MKIRKISFWILTIFFAGLMLFSAGIYLTHQAGITAGFHALGYPLYLLNILGTAKLIGVISLLQTKFKTLKEWAYAGFTINLIGAIWSHLALGQGVTFPVILFFVLGGTYLLWKDLISAKSMVSTREEKLAF